MNKFNRLNVIAGMIGIGTLLCQSAQAQDFPAFDINCNEQTNVPIRRFISVGPRLSSADIQRLEDETYGKRYLDYLAIEAMRRCKDVPMPALFKNYKQSPISELKVSTWNFGGEYDYGTKAWTRIDNGIAGAAVTRKRNEIAMADQERKRHEEETTPARSCVRCRSLSPENDSSRQV